jgi:hypothetical protein
MSAADDREPEVVPRGERDDLQRTARETGERFGSMDTLLAEHDKHLAKINGSIGDMATALSAQATSTAVMASSIVGIEKELASTDANTHRQHGISTQWLLAIFAAIVAGVGMFVTIVIALVVLIANGKL